MAETTLDVRDLPKKQAYATLHEQVEAVLSGLTDEIAAMATVSCILHQGFGHLWTGFYRAVEPGKLLRVGPYQGTLGCLEIPFGKGVCGTCASEGKTIVVADVNAFAGHITCDARSASEIVVPVFNRKNQLIAVLDIDSEEKSRFDDEDRVALEKMMGWFRQNV